jgi:hypothetical protein
MPIASIIALSGPQRMVEKMKFPDGTYDKVCKFYIPDDHGEFPDTSGYTRADWAEISSDMEDSQLWPHMQKCMDAVLDFVLSKGDTLEKLGMMNIKTDVNWPKQGGKVFAVTGFVSWTSPPSWMGKGFRIAQG